MHRLPTSFFCPTPKRAEVTSTNFSPQLSEGGSVIGTIGNILLDVSIPADLRIDAFELTSDLLGRLSGHHHIFSASRVTHYGRDVIVVPDAVAQALKNS